MHRFALQRESKEVEDVLADGAVIIVTRELARDRLEDDRRRWRQLGMFVDQRQKRPPAAQTNLEAGSGERRSLGVALTA